MGHIKPLSRSNVTELQITDLALYLTKLFNFGFHSVRLLLFSLKSSPSLAEMVTNQRYRAGSDQRLQTVWVAAQPAKHTEAPAAGVLVLCEVVEQAGHDTWADQSCTWVGGVGEARQQQQDRRLGRPGFRVVGVLVSHWSRHRGWGIKSDFSQTSCWMSTLPPSVRGWELWRRDWCLGCFRGWGDGGGTGIGLGCECRGKLRTRRRRISVFQWGWHLGLGRRGHRGRLSCFFTRGNRIGWRRVFKREKGIGVWGRSLRGWRQRDLKTPPFPFNTRGSQQFPLRRDQSLRHQPGPKDRATSM